MRTKKRNLFTAVFMALVTLCTALAFVCLPVKSVSAATETISLLDLSGELSTTTRTLTTVSGFDDEDGDSVINSQGVPAGKSAPTIAQATGSSGAEVNVLKMGGFFGIGWKISSNGVAFSETVPVSHIKLLEIKMYIDFSTSETYTPNFGGVRLYASDAVGTETGNKFYKIPSGTAQRQWVTLTVDPSLIADSNGNLSGLQFGSYSRVDAMSTTGDGRNAYMYYTTPYRNDQAFLYIESVTVTKRVVSESVEALKNGGLMLAAADGYYDKADGTLKYINGKKSIAPDCVNLTGGSYRDFKGSPNEGAVSGEALKCDFHSWGISATNTLVFKNTVKASDISGLVIRMYAHLSAASSYSTAQGGIRLYGSNQTGQLSSGYLIPSNITQDEWIELVLTKEEAALIADEQGNLSGLQIVGGFQASSNEEFYMGVNGGYILIDYICASKPVSVSFVSDGVEVKNVGGYAGASIMETLIPEKVGYAFAGWYNGETLYDFNSVLIENLTLTAKWVELASIAENAGLYVNEDVDGKYANGGGYLYLASDGTVDFKDVADELPVSYALGTDNTVYAVQENGNVTVYVLGDENYEAVSESVKVTLEYGNKTESVYIAKGDSLKEIPATRTGYLFVEWRVGDTAYDFTQTVNSDLVLRVVWAYDDASEELYAFYYGKFYDDETDTFIVLSADNKATFGGVEMEYYALNGGVIVFVKDGVATEYTLLAQRIISAEGNDYYRLGQYYVSFETNGGTAIEDIEVPKDTYKIEKPADPVKEGYTFKGWKLLDGTEFDFDKVIERSVTLYADWEKADGAIDEQKDKKSGCGCNSIASLGGITAVGILSAVLFTIKRRKNDE